MPSTSFYQDDCKTAKEALARAKRVRSLFWGAPEPHPVVAPVLAPPAKKAALPRAQTVGLPPSPPFAGKQVTFDFLVATVCAYFHFTEQYLLSEKKTADLVNARRVLIHLAIRVTPLSSTQIGRRISLDHSTVLHSRNRAAELVAQNDVDFIGELEGVTAVLRKTHPHIGEAFSHIGRPNHGTWWSQEEVDHLLKRCRDERADVDVVAKELGRDPEALRIKAAKLGFAIHLPKEGSPHSRYTEEQMAEVRRLKAQGLTYPEIGKCVGRSPLSVRHIVDRMRKMDRRASEMPSESVEALAP